MLHIRNLLFTLLLATTAAAGGCAMDDGTDLGVVEAEITNGRLHGGRGVQPFDTDITDDRVVAVTVWSGDEIDALQITYRRSNGTQYLGPKIGGPGGTAYTFEIHDDEDLIGFRGRAGARVDALVLVTTKRDSGRFGGYGGTVFSNDLIPEGTRFVGFHGRAGRKIDALGWVSNP